MSRYLTQLQVEISNTPPLPTAKTAKSPPCQLPKLPKAPFDSNDSAQGRPVSKIHPTPGPDLHGWTLEQVRDHCHPDEWPEVRDNPQALEAVAANLRTFPFLWNPMFRGRYIDAAEQAAREAAEERAAILEYEASLSRQEAERVAALAQDFYNHLFGTGKDTDCCHAPAGRYCPEGRRLRGLYYHAAKTHDTKAS